MDGVDKDGARKAVLLAAVLGGYWLLLIYNLGAQWSVYEQYGYGWSVPFLCGWLAWKRIQDHGSRITDHASRSTFHSSPAFFVLAASLALLYAPTRLLHEANPIWRLTSFLWAAEVIGLTLLLLPRALYDSPCPLRVRELAFPICFFLVAVPWPTSLESFLVQWLTQWNVRGTIEMLGLAGVPAIRHGNVIEVGTGEVGINEACSGIRSFQATLMISLFLGELYRLRVWRRGLLCVTGVVLAFVFNVGRTFLLAGIGSSKGIGAIASWHDPAGTVILVACFIGLWLAALLFRSPKSKVQGPEPEGTSVPTKPATCNLQPATFPVPSASYTLPPALTWGLLAWLLIVECGSELWYRAHEHSKLEAVNWSVALGTSQPQFKAVQVPKEVQAQFRYDDGFEGEWRDANGAFWQLYYFRWRPARSLSKRVAVQIAKAHGPEMCLPAIGMTLKADLGITLIPVGPLNLATHQFVFESEGRLLHVFYGIYEDQTGSDHLVNRRQTSGSRVEAALAGSRNFGQRFLEAAVSGYGTPEEARASFARELASLIKADGGAD